MTIRGSATTPTSLSSMRMSLLLDMLSKPQGLFSSWNRSGPTSCERRTNIAYVWFCSQSSQYKWQISEPPDAIDQHWAGYLANSLASSESHQTRSKPLRSNSHFQLANRKTSDLYCQPGTAAALKHCRTRSSSQHLLSRVLRLGALQKYTN